MTLRERDESSFVPEGDEKTFDGMRVQTVDIKAYYHQVDKDKDKDKDDDKDKRKTDTSRKKPVKGRPSRPSKSKPRGKPGGR